MPVPPMTPAQRLARKAEKEQQLLSFLVSELWTDNDNAALLWRLSTDASATSGQ